ncbi:MAG TPA: 50S ribosomal protein L15 [Candidatus Moranbacteria bacterium]|nr:50S ribosomal protein L15 [Candidatus Moranbacteria bacterium]
MQAHNLKSDSRKNAKRIARGGRRGTFSGRGLKGQKSRSGHSQRPTFEGGRSSLISRTKKVRGFKAIKTPLQLVNLISIERKYQDGETVSPETLKQKGLIKKLHQQVKILGNGELSKKVKFKDVAMSGAVKDKIEKK